MKRGVKRRPRLLESVEQQGGQEEWEWVVELSLSDVTNGSVGRSISSKGISLIAKEAEGSGGGGVRVAESPEWWLLPYIPRRERGGGNRGIDYGYSWGPQKAGYKRRVKMRVGLRRSDGWAYNQGKRVGCLRFSHLAQGTNGEDVGRRLGIKVRGHVDLYLLSMPRSMRLQRRVCCNGGYRHLSLAQRGQTTGGSDNGGCTAPSGGASFGGKSSLKVKRQGAEMSPSDGKS
ncbi:hypothetical protein AMTR_s00058p00146890 [Amborella trichopoda]|uniref:Uncharacterized protein n=1 Tax=Amborella trichopoda TaxID=13333 RepID=W1PG23_AMBTC|nr:hypothetical protein AMTR_s00058p00146890 [Amborella trichopoda]